MSVARLASVAAIVLVVSLAIAAAPAPAQDNDGAWPVKGKLIGKTRKSGEIRKSEDVSGIACTTATGFPRACLVIDDNLQEAQFVTVEDGRLVAGDTIRLIDDEFKGDLLELDGEGIAFSNGFYYVIGSHGHPRDSDGKLDPVDDADLIKARIAATSQIVRFRTTAGGGAGVERTSNLRKAIAAEPALAPFLDRRLEKNGLTIEGIAIRGDTLFAGFRGPVLDNDRAAILALPVDALFSGDAVQSRLFRLPLGEGRGIRDLAVFEAGVLILAGPVASGPGVYAIYWWDGESENAKLLSELTQFAPRRKPEGLLPLDRSANRLRLLILFDSDKEGTPTAVEVPAP